MTRRRFQIVGLFMAVLTAMLLPQSALAGPDTQTGTAKGKVFTPPSAPGQPPAPVADAIVKLTKFDGTVVADTHTNAEGAYQFVDVNVGPYIVKASKEGVGNGAAFTFVHAGPMPTMVPPIFLHAPPSGTSTVKGAVFTHPTPGHPPEPVADALVKLSKPDGTLVAETHTSNDGKYEFASVAFGPYTVKASKEGVGNGARQIHAHPGITMVPPIFLLPPPSGTGTVKGQVLSHGSPGHPPEPVADAIVKLTKPDGTVVAETHSGMDGKFEFAQVAVGPYIVKAAKEGVGAGQQNVFVAPNHTSLVWVMLHN